jgi:hypothetical protein
MIILLRGKEIQKHIPFTPPVLYPLATCEARPTRAPEMGGYFGRFLFSAVYVLL